MLNTMLQFIRIVLIICVITNARQALAQNYPWQDSIGSQTSLTDRIKPPSGYFHQPTDSGSFAHWLRSLPVKDSLSPVRLYDGSLKRRQDVHTAVIDIDVGSRDLQQCADAAIRLRAEYLFSVGRTGDIHFNFTSGDTARFVDWANGLRPIVSGNRVTWSESARADSSYDNFRRYLNTVFTYAGSYSISKELVRVPPDDSIQAGDIFIVGGFPGHVVTVVDIVIDTVTGRRAMLLVQSYMPAQDMHVLRNPNDTGLNPWYDCAFGQTLVTPEWTFGKGDLKRW